MIRFLLDTSGEQWLHIHFRKGLCHVDMFLHVNKLLVTYVNFTKRPCIPVEVKELVSKLE